MEALRDAEGEVDRRQAAVADEPGRMDERVGPVEPDAGGEGIGNGRENMPEPATGVGAGDLLE